MAITKIHPIKVNLKAALDYIENPDKTDDKMLVSSFGCSYETADIEFQMLLDQAFKKGNNLAQQEPGRGETLRRMRGRVHAEIQPGQILPGLRGADTPEERG